MISNNPAQIIVGLIVVGSILVAFSCLLRIQAVCNSDIPQSDKMEKIAIPELFIYLSGLTGLITLMTAMIAGLIH